jgi:hypothetical protein
MLALVHALHKSIMGRLSPITEVTVALLRSLSLDELTACVPGGICGLSLRRLTQPLSSQLRAFHADGLEEVRVQVTQREMTFFGSQTNRDCGLWARLI